MRTTARTGATFIPGLVLLIAVAAPASSAAAAAWSEGWGRSFLGQEASSKGERWKGVMELPGMKMEFAVTFQRQVEGEGYAATIDIPAQGVSGLALVGVVYTDEQIGFTIQQAPPSGAVFTATVSEDGKTATGELEQGGQKFPIHMERMEKGEAAVGPELLQRPRPPYPYQQRQVSYSNPADGTRLAGTLTIPGGQGPYPAVLLISGSGAQDRDETIFGHKPFLVLADHLSRHGIGVLRVDDRGVGGSSGSVAQSTSEDLAADVLAGVAFLGQQAGIDGRLIGLIGHSEGGIIAPMVAARSNDVAFIVLLAGTALPGRQIMPLQLAAIQRASGRSEENIRRQLEAQGKLLDRVIADEDEASIRDAVRELVKIQLSTSPRGQATPPERIEELIAPQASQLMTPWFRYFLTNDPKVWLRQVRCPVLALGGSLDLQVPAADNLPEMKRVLTVAGNADVTVTELAGLNHLFQTAATGSPAEYSHIEETFSPEALDLITEWIQQHTARR
ncbi:MAG: alpha/beta hydrolase family protein [Acidobacteriota bacterium]